MARTGSKMDVHFSSESTTWETPPEVFDPLHKEFKFTLDAAASKTNAKCKKYIDEKMNCFTGEPGRWAKLSRGGAVFMNPPYGRGIYRFIERAKLEAESGDIKVVCLLPARTDTAYFHDLCIKGEVRLMRGRVKFLVNGRQSDPAPFPTMVVVFGSRWTAKRMIVTWDP